MNMKAYEQSNHLGNVLVTVSDARQISNSGSTVTGYVAIVKSATDYSAFGAPMAGRTYTSSSYRYGFNGAEKSDEYAGSGNVVEFEYRVDDTRLARFFSQDPMSPSFPWNSPYAFAENMPIIGPDLEGLEQPNNPNTTQDPANTGTSDQPQGNVNETIAEVEAPLQNVDNLEPETVSSSGANVSGPRYDGCIGAFRPPTSPYSYSTTTTSVYTGDNTDAQNFIMSTKFGVEPEIDKVYETTTTVTGAYSADGKTFTETVTIVRTTADVYIDDVTSISQTSITSTRTWSVVGEEGKPQIYDGKSVMGPVLVEQPQTGSSTTTPVDNINCSDAFKGRLGRALVYNYATYNQNWSNLDNAWQNAMNEIEEAVYEK